MSTKNVELKVDGTKLVITIDLSRSIGPSKSGKTTLVATTGGNIDVPGVNGLKLGLNMYK
jgi:ABC-type uncharacterized transport system YnjBCD ATPase subunit